MTVEMTMTDREELETIAYYLLDGESFGPDCRVLDVAEYGFDRELLIAEVLWDDAYGCGVKVTDVQHSEWSVTVWAWPEGDRMIKACGACGLREADHDCELA
jgi:hypothetical protein